MFWGNLLLVGCCAFYLLWWIIAFRPVGAVRGMKSGWLLIPAFLLGLAAVVMILQGAGGAERVRSFFSARAVLLTAVAVYVVLLLMTRLTFHRQVTTELFLIVGWTALVFWEGNALYGAGVVTRNGALGLFAAALLAAAVSMVCYVLYYSLNARAGYWDGMVPLVLAAVYMAALAVLLVVRARG